MKQQPNIQQSFGTVPQSFFPAFGMVGQPAIPGTQAAVPQFFGAGVPQAQQLPIPMPTPPTSQTTMVQVPGMLPAEQSFIENILRLNKGKHVTVYTTFENNREWNAKIFTGIIEAAGRDHLILSHPQTGERYLIPMVFLDYVVFEEEINYSPEFAGAPSLSTFPPR